MNKKFIMFAPLSLAALIMVGCGGNDPVTPPVKTTKTITFKLFDKEITKEYEKGKMPSYDVPFAYDDREGGHPEIGHRFISWDRPLAPVTEDTTYTANYEDVYVKTSFVIPTDMYSNDKFQFNYEGELHKVDWGDNKTDSLNTHQYEIDFSKDNPIIEISIYGNISSISVPERIEGHMSLNNDLQIIKFADTVTTIPEKGFKGLHIDSVLLNENITSVGACAFENNDKNCLIYCKPGVNTSAYDHDWNVNQYRVVNNIDDYNYALDNDNNIYGYLINKDNVGNEHLSISAFVPKDDPTDTLTIPDTIAEHDVEGIIYSPFRNRDSIKTISLPNKLQYIGVEAFYWSALTSVTIPASVQELGTSAFEQSSDIESVTITDGEDNSSNLSKISSSAFEHCNSLKSITLPSSVTEMGSRVFAYDFALKTADLSKTQIQTLPSETFAFASSTSNSFEVKLPETVTTIGAKAFNPCCSKSGDTLKIDLSSFKTKKIPDCPSNAFQASATNNVKVIYPKSWGDSDTIKTDFKNKGWPEDATYTPSSEI